MIQMMPVKKKPEPDNKMPPLQRKLKGVKRTLSYPQIARQAGCSPENIRKILDQGTEPRFRLGVRIAQILGVPAEWLGDDSQDFPPPQSDTQQATELVRAALAKEGLAGELDKDERDLLTAWRTLSDADRTWIVGYVTGLAAGDTEGTADFAAALRRGKSREASKNTAS